MGFPAGMITSSARPKVVRLEQHAINDRSLRIEVEVPSRWSVCALTEKESWSPNLKIGSNSKVAPVTSTVFSMRSMATLIMIHSAIESCSLIKQLPP